MATEDPGGAAREIEKWAGHPHMSQILIKAEPRPSWGDPIYDPVWAAATKHDITVSCHLGRGKYETLRIVFVEHAFSWILPLMWRMDAIYAARKPWLDIKRIPSEHVKDHIKFTTGPLDYAEDKTELLRAFEWMECGVKTYQLPTSVPALEGQTRVF
ncbi:hypothetical protein MSAR_23260 [Mycolicibacterium sarraceniae]|uniref:Amidohydrolase n=1 Tax=Mycolicibacterium sarraceniae TaxID=1534348 RepID=A0A7I7SRH0_9MYCO|nr:hypothetical protein MSAR_23260 [Mycolicibacterium sarraceniae]